MNNTEHQLLQVEFTKVEEGWIHFTIILGNQKFEHYFSNVFDPILDFRSWLEAIAVGAQQVSFEWDAEAEDFKFDINTSYFGGSRFKVIDPCAPKRLPYIDGFVETRQLVAEFYNSFLEFINSDSYKKEEWEEISLSDYLCEKNSADPENLMKELNKISVEDLIKQICGENFVRLEDCRNVHLLNMKPKFVNYNKSEVLKFIKERLDWNVGFYDGFKLENFKSEIIERYLSN